MARIISAVYPAEGAPLLGFCCRVRPRHNHEKHCVNRGLPNTEESPCNLCGPPPECRSLFKTERGAWQHALIVHSIEHEPIIFEDETKANNKTDQKIDKNNY